MVVIAIIAVLAQMAFNPDTRSQFFLSLLSLAVVLVLDGVSRALGRGRGASRDDETGTLHATKVLVPANETVNGPELLDELRRASTGRGGRSTTCACPRTRSTPHAEGLQAEEALGDYRPLRALAEGVAAFGPDRIVISTLECGRLRPGCAPTWSTGPATRTRSRSPTSSSPRPPSRPETSRVRPRGADRLCHDDHVAERVWFESSTGPRLAGSIDHPEGAVRGWGVFAHGFTLGKDTPAASRICKQLAREGIGMLRFDNLGLGDSEGDWGDGSFSHKVEDTVQAARYLAGTGRPPALLVGHSFGGAAAIAAAPQVESVRAVASVGAPFEPAHVEHNYDALVDRILDEGEAPFLIGGKALTLRRHFIDDVRSTDLRATIRSLRRALLVMHSPTDNTVGIANASQIFRTARHPRSFVSLEGADHLLTHGKQAQRAARIISAWADPYLS